MLLVGAHDTDGANVVPAHHDILHLQQNRWRPWCGGESKILGRSIGSAAAAAALAEPQGVPSE